MSRDTFYQSRLLKAPSDLTTNTSRAGASTASLGSFCRASVHVSHMEAEPAVLSKVGHVQRFFN